MWAECDDCVSGSWDSVEPLSVACAVEYVYDAFGGEYAGYLCWCWLMGASAEEVLGLGYVREW